MSRMFIEEKDPERRRELMSRWVSENAGRGKNALLLEESEHIIDCFESIYNWYEKGWSPGGFTMAVLKNDFKQACFRADDINRKNLYLYALFLQWHLPRDYLDKVKTLK
jgi:hypothetical protein